MSKQLSAEILHKHCSHLFYKDDPDLLFVYKAMEEYADGQLIAAQERIKELEAKMKWIKASIEQELDSQDIIYFITKALTPNNKQKEDER